jgi:hypothetical protein
MGSNEPEIQRRDANVRRVRHLTAAIGALAASATVAFGVLVAFASGHTGGAAAAAPVKAAAATATATTTDDDETTIPSTGSQAFTTPTVTTETPVAVSGGS